MKKFIFAFVLFFSVTTAQAKFEFEEDKSLPIVYVNLALDVGAAQDPAGRNGLANLASRMLLRGTQNRTKAQFFETINKLGGQLDVDVRTEGTIIRGAVLSENLEPFLALVDEALTRPKFTSGELTTLKSEIEGLILEQKSSDQALAQYHFNRFLYGSHPYGNPVIGTRAGVKAITYKDVVDFYTMNVSDKTLHLFGSGDAKKDVLEKWFSTLGEKLSAIHPEAKPVTPVPTPQLAMGRRTLLVHKPNITQSHILLGGKGMRPETTPGFYAILLANHSFGGGSFQARMMQEIRVKRGWTYGASNSFKFGREPRHFAMYTFTKTAQTTPAIELMLSMFDDFRLNGIKRDEFEFARQSLVNNAPFNYDTPRKRLENATTEHLIQFPRGYFEEFANNIGKVSFDDIAPALKGALSSDNLTLTVIGDKTKLMNLIMRLPGFSAPAVKNYDED